MPTWDDFKQRHVLNPRRHPSYERWDKREQNNFLRGQLSAFGGNPNQSYGRKHMNSVIIATSQEILDDFRNPGVRFQGQEDFYWSNRRYDIWLYKKSSNPNDPDGAYSVTKLNLKNGPMHFLARTTPRDQYKPIHFHAQSPTPDPHGFPRF